MKSKGPEKQICFLLEKKLELYEQYLCITKTMRETLKEKGATHLGSLLSQRQDCIERIEKTDFSLENVLKPGSAGLNCISEKGKKSIEACIIHLRDIMNSIELLDREFPHKVKEEAEGIKRELLEIHNVRQAARGYKNERRYPPRFLDTMR